MSKIAFIYPGQGAQATGMGADFCANSPVAEEIFNRSSRLLGMDMKALCFEKNDDLDKTEYTQAAMVTTCLAMTRVLEERGVTPDVTAGLSLGEYCAIAVSGGMSDSDAIRTVRKRGILMQNTVPAGEGAMAAVLGMTGEAIDGIIEGMEKVTVANYNCPGQIVITGETKAVEEACVRLKEAGAKRTVMLNVSGPFHSPMLKPAGEELLKVLDTVEFKELKLPYVTNVTAEVITDISRTKELLKEQVSASVRWQQSMERMIEDGTDIFVEIGPGKTLTGFLRKINKNVTVYHVGTWEEMEEIVKKFMSMEE